MGFKFIFCGESTYNLKMAIDYNVIGVGRGARMHPEEKAVFVVKKDGEWNVCSTAVLGEPTDSNPFDFPERYYTHNVTDIKTCRPFAINDLCRDKYGKYWGLKFQHPVNIEDEDFVKEIESRIKYVDKAELYKCLGI